MRNRFRLWMTSALAATVLTGGFAFNSLVATAATDAAKPGAAVSEHSGKACKGGHKWADLKLTDEQKAQMKAIVEKYRPAMKPLFDQFKTERGEMMKLTHADVLDDAAIKAEATKLAALAPDLAVQRAHVLKELRAVLTPDQVQKLTEGKKGWKMDFFLMRMARKMGKEDVGTEPDIE